MKKKNKIVYSHSPLSWRTKRYLKKQGYKSVVSKYCPVGKIYLLNDPAFVPLKDVEYTLMEPWPEDTYNAKLLAYGTMLTKRNTTGKFTDLIES